MEKQFHYTLQPIKLNVTTTTCTYANSASYLTRLEKLYHCARIQNLRPTIKEIRGKIKLSSLSPHVLKVSTNVVHFSCILISGRSVGYVKYIRCIHIFWE